MSEAYRKVRFQPRTYFEMRLVDSRWHQISEGAIEFHLRPIARNKCGVTLMELVIAMAMIAIIFAVVVPQFVVIRNSWDVKQGSAEALQNGRVLMDHINRNLSKAVRITAVSAYTDTDGYIEFEDNDGNTLRYDIAASNYVEYGTAGNLADLAGPVGSLTFTCYDACDLDSPLSPVTDTNDVRVVKVDATFSNSASMGQDKTFSTWVYLRVNSQSQDCWENQDVGDVAAAGSASCASYVWTIEGSGADLGPLHSTDEFHFVYQSLSGDGQIIARVVSIENTGAYAKAGVVIRETLNGNSRYAGILVTPNNGVFFQSRSVTGGSTSYNWPGYSAQAPCWLKVIRSGNTFSGYVSTNGSTWAQVGSSVSIALATDTYIGMAVCSSNDGVLCTAVIDNVTFAAITYETFNEAKTSSGVTLTINTPSTDTGDLLIAAVATDGDTSSTLSPPSGWTAINVDDYSGEVTLGVWWRVATASEPATHQFSWTGARPAYGWIMCFAGQDPTNPINAWSVGPGGQTSSTPTSPAVNATVDGCMILRLGAFDDSDINALPEPGNPGLPGHTAITMDQIGVALFQDSFETGFASWTTDWSRVTDYARPGGMYSARAGRYDSYLTSGNINTSTYSSFTVEFWYRDYHLDDGDNVYLRFYDGSSYDPIYELGNTWPESTWHYYQATVTDAQYRRSNFRIRFDASGISSSNEYIWIDDVLVSAGGVSGGAGYVRQSAAGSSGPSTFTLTASQESRMLTIAIAPAVSGNVDCCGDSIRP
jgi:type II secretory pathway pseudopilin PulG